MKIILIITLFYCFFDIKSTNGLNMNELQNFCLVNQNCVNNPINNYCCSFKCCSVVEYITKDGYIFIYFIITNI